MRTPFAILFVLSLLALASCMARPEEPLSIAAANGDFDTIQRLLNQGASAADRQSALVWAARSGQPDAIYLLIRNGADPNGVSGVNNWTVLMHAVHKNQPKSVAALLKSGVRVNAAGERGQTALMMAAGYGYTDLVRLLLDGGADAHATLSNGDNSLDLALSGVMDIDRFTWGSCQTETVKLLRERAPDLTPKNPHKLAKCS
jgi:ankyrin repeat protein